MPDYKPRFARKPFPKKDFGQGPKQLFKANCANCHDVCEVPFRPNGKKPVFCSNCFTKETDNERPSYGPKRDFAPRPSFSKEPRPHAHGNEEMQRELRAINEKLERLIVLMTPVEKKPAAKKAATKKK